MKIFEWNAAKNKKLKQERDISFEEVVFYIEKGSVIDIVDHPNGKRYPGQKVFIIDIDDYIYLVPFVENDEVVFLKTIIPSRKATREYLKR
jgi:hypothetical protein